MNSYFRKIDENIIIAIPLICFFLSAIQFLFFQDSLRDSDPHIVRFVVNVFLLNSTHLALPFILLLSTQTGQRYWIEKSSTVSFWKKAVALFFLVSLFSLCYLHFFSFDLGFIKINPLSQLFFWIWILFPTFHGIRQSGGLFLLFSQSYLPNLKIKYLREILNIYYLMVVLALIFQVFSTDSTFIFLGGHICSFISFALALFLILACYRHSGMNSFRVSLFTIRLLFWPLAFYSQLATWLLPLMHGSEYFALMRRIGDKNTDSKVKMNLLILLSILLILIHSSVVLYFYKSGFNFQSVKYNPLFALPLAFFPFFTILHYITDGIIYRMKDPVVKRTLGKDLFGLYEANQK